MPELIIDDLNSSAGRFMTRTRLIAVMAWPGDEKLRSLFEATVVGELISILDDVRLEKITDTGRSVMGNWIGVEQISDPQQANQVREGLVTRFSEVQGFAALADPESIIALNKRLSTAYDEWQIVGRVLHLYMTHDANHREELGEPSLRQAQALTEWFPPTEALQRSTRQIQQIWRDHAPVVHLCAAYHAIVHAVVAKSIRDEKIDAKDKTTIRRLRNLALNARLEDILSVARVYLGYLSETHNKHDHRAELVNTALAWSIPALFSETKLKLDLPEYSPAMMRWAKDYKNAKK